MRALVYALDLAMSFTVGVAAGSAAMVWISKGEAGLPATPPRQFTFRVSPPPPVIIVMPDGRVIMPSAPGLWLRQWCERRVAAGEACL